MKLIIAGTRYIKNDAEVFRCLDRLVLEKNMKVDKVLSGGAKGPDRIGEQWAAREGIPVVVFPAAFSKHGKAAGPMRNEKMAEAGDALVLFWDGMSPGSLDMLSKMKERVKKVYVFYMGTAHDSKAERTEEI